MLKLCMRYHTSDKPKKTLESKYSITEGTIWKALLVFFFPILVGTLFQQLYNTIDAVIIGKSEGKEALAAVGGGTAVYLTLLIGFFVGISSGSTVVISQLIGAKRPRATSRAVHTSLSLAFVGGIIMTLIGIASSGYVLKLMDTPEEITALSREYLHIYFFSMVPMFIYNMVSGILRAAGDSRTPLYTLIAAVITNIILDLLFVVFFKWGVAGVAWATVLSQAESMIISLIILKNRTDSIRFYFSHIEFCLPLLAKILRIGFPTGVQSTFYGVSNIIIQSAINSFGTITIAAWASYSKLDGIFWTVVSAMGVALTTFAGQNYGAGKYERIKQSMWQALGMTALFTIFAMGVFLAMGVHSFFLFTSDIQVAEEGFYMLKFLSPLWITYISIEVLSGVIRGAGDAFKPMIISLFGICLLRIVWLFGAVPMNHTITTVMASYPITWTVTSIMYWIYYTRGNWLRRIHKEK